MNSGKMMIAAWKLVSRLPRSLVERIAETAGVLVAAAGGKSVQQMRRNYQHLTGREPTRRELARGVASYYRCYAQQFTLGNWPREQVARCTGISGVEGLDQLLAAGPVIVAVTHSGNWDMAAGWFARTITPVVTVAEKLDPPELFEEFTDLRQDLGMEIIGVDKNDSIFSDLLEQVRGRQVLVPILADRDISGSGIEVQLGEGRALVAAGPAALAVKLNRPLITAHLVYHRVDGEWRVEIRTAGVIEPEEPLPGETAVEALTRQWAAAVAPLMQEELTDWHMMQKLYVDDLDPERLARARKRHVAALADQADVSGHDQEDPA